MVHLWHILQGIFTFTYLFNENPYFRMKSQDYFPSTLFSPTVHVKKLNIFIKTTTI